MDPRIPNTQPYQFGRPSSQPDLRGLQHGPVPPPPYAIQAPARPPSLGHDPFIPRRQEQGQEIMGYEKGRMEYERSFHHEPRNAAATDDTRMALSIEFENRQRARENEQRWRYEESRDRFGEAKSRVTQEVPPPPPPPPFSNRPMLPPSPSYNARPPTSQVPPPPPPFSGARDLPAPSSATRPSSSMSISAMLDSAPSRPSRESSAAAQMNGTSPNNPYIPISQPPLPPSPTRPNQVSSFPRRTPPQSHTPTNRPFRAYSGGGLHQSCASTKSGSPDGSTNGPLSSNSLPQFSPQSETAAHHDWRQESRQEPSRDEATTHGIGRPASQPSNFLSHLQELEKMNKTKLLQVREEQRAAEEEAARREASIRQGQQNGVTSFEFLGRREQLERQHQLQQERLERQRRMEQEQQDVAQGREERVRETDYPFLARSSLFSEQVANGLSPEKDSSTGRNTVGSQNHISRPPNDEALRRLQEDQQRLDQQRRNLSPSLRPRFPNSAEEKQQQFAQGSEQMQRTRSIDSLGPHRMDDGASTHRAMLGAMLGERRTGRASPLPQAVQGAQGQTRGPSSDPSIKNEFSRMFAGIGSGVGSASGASTPFNPPSPKPENDHRTPFGNRKEIMELVKSRNDSRMGKKSRRMKDDDSKDVEILEDRARVKRGRHGNKPHHHHHDGAHHRHRLEENGSLRLSGGASTPIDRRLVHHPHHSLDAAGNVVHHHNHSKAKLPPRIPSIVINNDAILESIRTIPRRHLGSVLYAPEIKAPDSRHDTVNSRYIIPCLDGRENCTLTVRVPRCYLSKEERALVCSTREVYGTDVYTDDTDPLGAAIHAGWISGDWGDDSILEALGIDLAKKQDTELEATLTSPPASPMLPPDGKDSRLTLLILPPLQKYSSKLRNGMLSEPWGNDHDGMSFRIEKIEWVDEGAGRGEERSGAAKRKRSQMAREVEDKGPALPLKGGNAKIGKVKEGGQTGTAAA